MLRAEPKRDPISAIRAQLALRALNVLIKLVHGCFKFKGIEVVVPKGCFAPLFISTGLLFDTALKAVAGRGIGCEIGTGVGSLALAMMKAAKVEIVGTDIDLRCLRAASANAKRNSLDQLFHPVACTNAQALRSGSVDFVVTNPPYLPLPPSGPAGTAACGGLELEILNELLQDAVRVVREGGVLLFSTSSLSSVSGAKLIRERWALFDSVQAYVYEKERTSL